MERLGIQHLQQALEGDAHRDLEKGLKGHLARLEAAQGPADTLVSISAEAPAPRLEKPGPPEPLSDLFLALCESVAQTYLERRQPDSAMKVVWEAFVTHPGLAEYRALRDWALKAAVWDDWRSKAWAHLRDPKTRAGVAVGILLWEGHLEEAWNEARFRGASDAEWLELARRREQDYPEQAAEIYRLRIEQLLPRSDLPAYREALKWLRRVESLQTQLGRDREFADLLASVRARHRRRPRLLQLLEEGFGPEPGGQNPESGGVSPHSGP